MNSKERKKIEEKSEMIGNEMFQLMEELYPICRSITGDGVRQTLEILKKEIPIQIHEIPTGEKVFDWTIPKEWNIKDAYIIDPSGKKIVDFKESNLHILNYSIPINQKISLSELKKHIHTIPEKPNVIPYVTSYYSENWGFCMTHNNFLNLKEGEYEIVIDSKLEKGNLTYGEFFIPGKSEFEILLSCYVCHPSMCNDNLSGVVLLTEIAKYIKNIKNNYSIRFIFVPETIGAITWIKQNEENLTKIKHGLVATCIGDSGKFTYKRSRQGDSEIDETVIRILKKSKLNFKIVDFFPWGSDERQFCSPGFNLPIGSLMRSMYGTKDFPEYHTSADNLEFINKKSLKESFVKYLEIIESLEENFSGKDIDKKEKNMNRNSKIYQNLIQKCEPQLGKRGIYRILGGQNNNFEKRKDEFAIFWVLNLSDGTHSLKDISVRSNISLKLIEKAADILIEKNLLKKL